MVGTSRAPLRSQAPSCPPHSRLDDAQALATSVVLVSLGLSLLSSAGLVTGGPPGLAILLSYATGWPLGQALFIVNLPFYALAWRGLGAAFTFRTLGAVTALSVGIELVGSLLSVQAVHPLYAAVAGGTIIGLGLLVMFRHGASFGGINILALHLHERYGWSAGVVQLAIDAAIFGAAFSIMSRSGSVGRWSAASPSMRSSSGITAPGVTRRRLPLAWRSPSSRAWQGSLRLRRCIPSALLGWRQVLRGRLDGGPLRERFGTEHSIRSSSGARLGGCRRHPQSTLGATRGRVVRGAVLTSAGASGEAWHAEPAPIAKSPAGTHGCPSDSGGQQQDHDRRAERPLGKAAATTRARTTNCSVLEEAPDEVVRN